MAGIRLTLDRQWPELFVKYPLPWRVDNDSIVERYYARDHEALVIVSDARGTALASGMRHVVNHMVMDVYAYVVPWFGITGMPLRDTVPRIFQAYKLPWHVAGADVLCGIHRLCSANNRVIRGWYTDDAMQSRTCEIMLALSEIVRHRLTLRGDAGGNAIDAG